MVNKQEKIRRSPALQNSRLNPKWAIDYVISARSSTAMTWFACLVT